MNKLHLVAVSGCTALAIGSAGQSGGPSVAEVMAMADDTSKVLKLSDLCFAYRRINADSALFFGAQALRLAQRSNYPRGEAQALNDMAIIHIDRSDFTSAENALKRALAIRTQLHDTAGAGAVHNKLGNVYQAQSRFEEALEQNIAALRIFERIGPPAKEALILNNIAILQNNLRRPADALLMQQRAVVIFEAIGDTTGLATSWGNMANARLALGDTALAKELYARAAAHFRKKDMQRELGVQLHNLAGLLLGEGDAQGAERAFREALTIRERVGEKKAIASSLTGLGKVLMSEGRWAEALPLFRRALALSREVNARSEVMQALQDLALVHARLDHGDSTYRFYEQYVLLRDSVFNADMAARLAEMETSFETERKEREILQQRASIAQLEGQAERRRFWLAVALGGIALVSVSALLVLQVQRRRAAAARDAAIIGEREQGFRNMVDRMEAERRRIAADLHDGLGQQIGGLRFRLEGAAQRDPALQELLSIVDEAGREVRGLAHQMMPRALEVQGLAPAMADMLNKALDRPGMQHRFDAFGMDVRLPRPVETGVYRIAQELISNVIRHADASRVEVNLLRNKGHLVLIVEDDGRGFDTTLPSSGLGLQGMHDRARMLDGTLSLERAGDHGTIATLRVPLNEEGSA